CMGVSCSVSCYDTALSPGPTVGFRGTARVGRRLWVGAMPCARTPVSRYRKTITKAAKKDNRTIFLICTPSLLPAGPW
ncbi:MAG TPA: hypothetical protein PKM41_16490, partial [Deltaproteobacteria bacterium]|nr:hypothetical protein [Deltaproteobacteria bacterium]